MRAEVGPCVALVLALDGCSVSLPNYRLLEPTQDRVGVKPLLGVQVSKKNIDPKN